MSVKPISPREISTVKFSTIPDQVFEAFNELIVKDFNGRVSVVRMKDVVNLIASKMPDGFNTKDLFANGWMDVEGYYRQQGWIVEFEKPGYNETGESIYTFKMKR